MAAHAPRAAPTEIPSSVSDPEGLLTRWLRMNRELENLRRRMEAAVAAFDFEEGARLRDQISLLRGNPDGATHQDLDTSRLRRQAPGRMGLGTSEQAVSPPPGWKPPKRPDPMTKAHKPARSRKR